MRADVPPDMRVVRDAPRLLQLADDLGVVRVVPEARRRARAGKRGEDHLPARGKTGRLAPPEGRVRREGKEIWEMDEQGAHHLYRLLAVVHSDVNVQPEDELAPGDVLELVDEVPVAIAGGDPLALEEAEGVSAGRADP